MKLETWLIANLVPDPQNARTHDKRNLDAIAASLEKFGQRKPIVITAEGIILAGNGTVQAAKQLGWKQVEVTITPKEWDYATARAYALADNRSAELAEWDTSVLASQLVELDAEGWDIGKLGFDVPEPTEPIVEDEGPLTFDEEAEPVTKLGDVYQLGRHRLMCGDSADSLSLDKLLDGATVEAIVTDPPYGIGIDGQKQSVNKNPKHNRKAHEFRNWDSERPAQDLFNTILTLNVPTVIWGGNYFADLLPATRGWIYWNKGQDGLTMSDGELAWTTESKPLRAVTVNRGALQGSVHPTQKPLQVIIYSLDYIEAKGNVLDLFGGSGSTLIAAEQTNRTAYVMELDPKYCDVIVKRWETLTGKKAELVKAE